MGGFLPSFGERGKEGGEIGEKGIQGWRRNEEEKDGGEKKGEMGMRELSLSKRGGGERIERREMGVNIEGGNEKIRINDLIFQQKSVISYPTTN